MIFRKAEKKLSMSWCCELWEREEHITPESLAAVERSFCQHKISVLGADRSGAGRSIVSTLEEGYSSF